MQASGSATRLDHVLVAGLVLGPLAGLVAVIAIGSVSMIDLALFLAFWLATLIGIELGYHRLFSHRAFRTKRWFEAFLVITGSMSFQGPAIWWAATHRHHHAHADRPEDPHSPHRHGGGTRGMLRGLWDAHVGWNFRAIETIRDNRSWKHLVPDLAANRWLRAVNRGYFLWMALGLALPAALGGLLHGTWHGVFTGFLWGGLVRLFVVNHSVWAVNSLCHGFGTRPFALHARDRSTNNFPLALVTLGGGWHHNHHVFPGAATTAIEPWQIDVGGGILRMLSWFGVVWDLGEPDLKDPSWRREVRVCVSGIATGFVSGLTERSAFVELDRRRGAACVVGSRVTLRDFAVVGGEPLAIETEATIDRVTWHGIAVSFEPNTAIADTLTNLRRNAS